MHVEWILMDVSWYLYLYNGFGWIPIAWIGVGEETWSFSLEVGDGWMFWATPKFCVENWKPRTDTLDLGWPESCLPWLSCPLAIGFVGLWGRRPFVTSPSAPKSWVITSYRIPFGTGFWNHSYEMLWTQMNTTSCYGQTIGILVRGFHGSQMVTHRSIMIHPNFDTFPFISYFFWLLYKIQVWDALIQFW